MRSRRERLERLLCAEHCRYYKPWEKGEARCAPFLLLLESARGSDEVLDALERLRRERLPGALRAHDALLLRAVCTRCEYYPDACAYRKVDHSAAATPCGGLCALGALVQREALVTEALYGPVWSGDVATPSPPAET